MAEWCLAVELVIISCVNPFFFFVSGQVSLEVYLGIISFLTRAWPPGAPGWLEGWLMRTPLHKLQSWPTLEPPCWLDPRRKGDICHPCLRKLGSIMEIYCFKKTSSSHFESDQTWWNVPSEHAHGGVITRDGWPLDLETVSINTCSVSEV